MKTLSVVMFLVAVQVSPVLAQEVDYAPARDNEWITYLVALGLAGLALVGSFMSSRRGHQD